MSGTWEGVATVGKLQRVGNVLLALLMILGGVLLLLDPKNALLFVAMVLGFSLVVYGVRLLVYYITMARHMVGGLSILFIAVIAVDLGSLALAFYDQPKVSIIIYLVGYNAFTGIVAVARAIESRIFESRWLLTLAHGLVNIALAVLCLVFIGSDQIVITIFCFGLFYNACIRLISALKPTEIIYIQ